jgi:hypothetical protein
LTQVEQLLGVLLQDVAGIGENAVAGGAVEEGFADFQFQFADGLTYCRLGAEELFGGAGEAALASYGEEDF